MMKAPTKQRNNENALAVERRLMKEAMARLERIEPGYSSLHAVGRLIFGLDLTGSREQGLGRARIATAGMFDTVKNIGAIAVKLGYYRGIDECRISDWYDDYEALGRSMAQLNCESGNTQIAKFLRLTQTEEQQLSGVVFIGDHCEDNRSELRDLARSFGLKSIPLFIFHECQDHDERSLKAKPIFKQMAALSGGVYVEFKPDSGAVLNELLADIASFSAGGSNTLESKSLPKTTEGRLLRSRLLLGLGKNQ